MLIPSTAARPSRSQLRPGQSGESDRTAPRPRRHKDSRRRPAGQADNGDGVSATYFYTSGDTLNSYNITGSFDQKLSGKHQLTVRYIYGHAAESDPFHDEVLPGYGNTASIQTTHNGVISIASALSTRTTNLFRGGYNQNNGGFFCNHAGFDALTGTDPYGNGRDITLPGFFTFGCVSLGGSNAQARLSSIITFADTFTVNKGAHSIKFGGEFHSVKDNSFDNFFSREQIALNEHSTNGDVAYTFAGNPKSPSYTNFKDLVFGRQGAVANTSEYQFFTTDLQRRAQENDLPYDGTITTPTVATSLPPGTLTPSANIGNGSFNEPVVIDPNLKMPTSETYNIGVQHQFGKVTAEVNYVGGHGTHIRREIDGAPPQPALVAALLASGVKPSSLQRNALYTTYPATYHTAFLHELFQTSTGGSNYNGLQLKATGQIGGLRTTPSLPAPEPAAYLATPSICAPSTAARPSTCAIAAPSPPAISCLSAAEGSCFEQLAAGS